MAPLPLTLDPLVPAGSGNPSAGDDEIRGIKDYLISGLGVPDTNALTAAAFSISTAGVVTISQTPLVVPTLIRGVASRMLVIESGYTGIFFRMPSGLLAGGFISTGLHVASHLIVDGRIQAGAAPRVITTATGMLDARELSVPGEVQGDVLIRSSSGWARLAPGSSGQVLRTRGTGADPLWVTI